MMQFMYFWQRLLITFLAMLVTSFVAGLICDSWLGLALPSYAAGIIGGMTALPVWELLKRISIKHESK